MLYVLLVRLDCAWWLIVLYDSSSFVFSLVVVLVVIWIAGLGVNLLG